MAKEFNDFEEILSLLDEISEDQSIPKNIKRSIVETKAKLSNKKEPLDIRIAGAIFILDDIVTDPNIPIHGRTAVYTIIGKLEGLSKAARK